MILKRYMCNGDEHKMNSVTAEYSIIAMKEYKSFGMSTQNIPHKLEFSRLECYDQKWSTGIENNMAFVDLSISCVSERVIGRYSCGRMCNVYELVNMIEFLCKSYMKELVQ